MSIKFSRNLMGIIENRLLACLKYPQICNVLIIKVTFESYKNFNKNTTACTTMSIHPMQKTPKKSSPTKRGISLGPDKFYLLLAQVLSMPLMGPM
jgi:hypothetical protein